MRYFAIKHKPTKYFLPGGKRRRGFTHDIPTSPTQTPPRLFLTERAAKSALRWWLEGTTVVRYVRNSTPWGEDDSEDWQTLPVPERKPEDMEVVSLELRIVQ